ncbi:MAG: hypothetical protein U0800_15635 [Isosphaeraceae bacterium]
MKTLVLLAALTFAGLASTAQAQSMPYPPSLTTSYSGGSPGPAFVPQYGYYSFYVVSPLPARGYVGYGANDAFPYYGQPYGHAYDAWTWDAMGGAFGNRQRFFYVPVR